jgi:hypothetical protein
MERFENTSDGFRFNPSALVSGGLLGLGAHCFPVFRTLILANFVSASDFGILALDVLLGAQSLADSSLAHRQRSVKARQ